MASPEPHATRPLPHGPDRSHWPALLGAGVLLLAVGLVLPLWPVALLALGLTAVAAAGWWREAGRERGEEGRPAGAGEPAQLDLLQRMPRSVVFVIILLVSDAMLFAGGLRALVTHRLLQPEGWPFGGERLASPLTWSFTGLLVASSAAAWWMAARPAGPARRRILLGAAATGALGALFLAGVGVHLAGLAAAGFAPWSGPAASSFWWLVSLHALHVVLALFALALLAARALAKDAPAPSEQARAVAIAWHFLVVVWLLLYGVLHLRVIPLPRASLG